MSTVIKKFKFKKNPYLLKRQTKIFTGETMYLKFVSKYSEAVNGNNTSHELL